MWFEVYKFLSGTIIIGCGFFLGYTIVSMYVYKEQKVIAANLTDDEKLEQSIQEFVTKYLEDYKALDRDHIDEETIKALSNITLMEETPLGIVKMYYSHDNESFIYWSERQVPYKVLESVSRKYVIDNDCKSIHYDMEEEIAMKKKELLEATQEEEEEEEPANSVFVTFKKTKVAGEKKPILCDNANRYSYRGKYQGTGEAGTGEAAPTAGTSPSTSEAASASEAGPGTSEAGTSASEAAPGASTSAAATAAPAGTSGASAAAPTGRHAGRAIGFAEYLKLKEKGIYTINGGMYETRNELQEKVKELIQEEGDRQGILECETLSISPSNFDTHLTPSTDEIPQSPDKKNESWLW